MNSTKTYAIDWGQGDKLTIYDGEKSWSHDEDLLSFVRERSPCLILIEPTFESYHRKQHNVVIDESDKLGTKILTLPTRKTAQERKNRGIEKSDENDAVLIWTLYHEGKVHYAPARRWPLEKEETRLEQVEILRRRGYPKQDCAWLNQYVPKDPPKEIIHAFGDGVKKLSVEQLYPLIAIALDTLDGSRKDFDRKVGMFGHGHPSFVRSNMYYHRMSALVWRALKTLNPNVKKSAIKNADPALRKQALKELRRATRWVFWHVKCHNEGHI